jgi:hypothetical protein
MRAPLLMTGLLAAVMPLAMEAPREFETFPDSLGQTRVRLAGGAGTYAFVVRGCEGQVIGTLPVHYRDAGVSLDHRFAGSPIRVGVRAGMLHDEIGGASGSVFGLQEGTTTNRYVNPNFEIDRGNGAVSLGWVVHERDFITTGEGAREQPDHPLNDLSASVRFGRPEGRYFAVRWMESVPLYSEGGYLTMGLGGSPQPGLELSVGMSAGGPFEGAGLFARGAKVWESGLGVTAAGRTGLSEPAAVGATLGIEYRTGSRSARSR